MRKPGATLILSLLAVNLLSGCRLVLGGPSTPLPPIRVPSAPAITVSVATLTPLPSATVTPPLPTRTPTPSVSASTIPEPSRTASPQPSPLPEPSNDTLPATSSLVAMPNQTSLMYAVIAGRFFRSTNGGFRWVEADRAGVPAAATCYAVTIDYNRPETMYLLTSEGIYRQVGAGAWGRLSTLRASALAVDRLNSSILWAGVGGTIQRSLDGGRTWARADTGLETWQEVGAGARRVWVSDIVQDTRNTNILWAVVRLQGSEDPPLGLLYRGRRDGRWERLSLGAFEPWGSGNINTCQVTGIAFDPATNLLFAGCDRCAFNKGRLLLIRSLDADSAEAKEVNWEVAKRVEQPSAPCYAPGAVRPLAVDTRAPKKLYVSKSIVDCITGEIVHRLESSTNNGETLDFVKQGLP